MKKYFGAMILAFIFGFLALKDLYAYKVVVTIEPQRYFLSKIAGEIVEPVVLVPPGADLHTFEMKPSQIKDISKAKIYFAIGDPIEISLKNKIKAINKDIKIIDSDANIQKISMDHYHSSSRKHHDAHGHEHPDPHIWLSPKLAKIIAHNMLDGLMASFPDHKDVFKKNFDDFMKEIDALHDEITQILQNIQKSRAFLVYHPSWGYFAKDYDLVQLSIEYKGREPSTKKLAEIIELAKSKDIKTIFIQPQISSRTAEIIAKEIGAKIVTADPLAFEWRENLRRFALKIRDPE